MIIFVLLMLTPFALAAEKDGLKYSGESYYAVVRKGVQMRDKDFKETKYLKEGTLVRVWGDWEVDVSPSRVVVDDQYGDFGTVIKRGLKKISSSDAKKKLTSSKLAYSGASYNAEVKEEYLNVRDANYKIIGRITQGENVKVLGDSDTWSVRSVISFNCPDGKATVLTSGLRKVSSSSSKPNKEDVSYYAVVRYKLNLRDDDGNLICEIPRAAKVKVECTNSKDKTRFDVTYKGKKGSVLKEGVKKVDDAIFTDIESQTTTLIRNGKVILEGKCVTGMLGTEDTPKGFYRITELTEHKVFPSGKESEFWGRIGDTHCGFHDAPWRHVFGGNVYKTNGSNGCVNQSPSFMRKFYKNIYVGIPVYIW